MCLDLFRSAPVREEHLPGKQPADATPQLPGFS
jgi:hypothetical protein